MSDFDDLADFCARLLGTDSKAPLKDHANGSVISALLDGYVKLRGIGREKSVPRQQQNIEDPMWREPWTVYVIKNLETGCAYVGSAKNGFVARYPAGDWANSTHSERLKRDALAFGTLSFKVSLFPCEDEKEMLTMESRLQVQHRLCTYNLRPEPENA